MQTQLKVLQCPSDSTDKRVRTDQSEWRGNPPTPVAVTSYKGVLDDTFLGQPPSFGGSISNDGTTYPSGMVYKEPRRPSQGREIAITIFVVEVFSSGNRFSGR